MNLYVALNNNLLVDVMNAHILSIKINQSINIEMGGPIEKPQGSKSSCSPQTFLMLTGYIQF